MKNFLLILLYILFIVSIIGIFSGLVIGVWISGIIGIKLCASCSLATALFGGSIGVVDEIFY